MMVKAKWDLALICDEINKTPEQMASLIKSLESKSLSTVYKTRPDMHKNTWKRIVAALEAASVITEMTGANEHPDNRPLKVSFKNLKVLIKDIELIINILPYAKNKFFSGTSCRVAATIPEDLFQLKRFFEKFENTALGLRRLIGEAKTNIKILVPFMDSKGLAEIEATISDALQRGVDITFLTRKLVAGGKNIGVLKGLITADKNFSGSLTLFDAAKLDRSPISHAKVVSRDNGAEVYTGSANLTSTSMGKTVEVGLFLKGKEAEAMDRFLSLIESVSQKIIL